MPVKHGTNRGYTFYKCRCDLCRDAHRLAAALDRQRNSERVNATKRRRYTEAPELAAAANRRWRTAHPEQVRAYEAMRYVRDRERRVELVRVNYLLNRQAYIERAARWKAANPERARELDQASRARAKAVDPAAYKMREAERMRTWRQNNLDHARARERDWNKTPQGRRYAAAQRAARRGVPYSEEALEWIASLVDPPCTYCGGVATEIDHIIAVSKGGTGELENLTPACRTCNARKSAMSAERFLSKINQSKES